MSYVAPIEKKKVFFQIRPHAQQFGRLVYTNYICASNFV